MSTKNLVELMAQKKAVHLIGIGGCGMSAIAKVLLKKGFTVTGSDAKESVNTINLKDLGARVFIGHSRKHIMGNSVVVVSAAIKEDNPELKEAINNKFPVFQRAQMLGYLMSLYPDSIAFAGTHGKTTTSAMAAVLFDKADLDPTFLVGGDVIDLGTSAKCGNSDFAIAEADESDGSIQYLDPRIFVLNNIEKDHLDHFNGLDEIIELFEKCLDKLKEQKNNLLVINSDQWGNQILLKKIKDRANLNIVTFGLSDEVDIRAINIRYQGKGSSFTLVKKGQVVGDVELSVPGKHNILNALAVIAVAFHAGLEFSKIRVGISSFTGANRRFTLIGEVNDVAIYDDYAHHPTEIEATLNAARHAFPDRRLLCAFQPHRYSRTMFFMKEFAKSLELADQVIITHLYAAGEAPIADVKSEDIADRIKKSKVKYIDKKDDIAGYLLDILKPGDVFFTLGAGDIYTVGREVVNRLKNKAKDKGSTDAGKIIRIA